LVVRNLVVRNLVVLSLKQRGPSSRCWLTYHLRCLRHWFDQTLRLCCLRPHWYRCLRIFPNYCCCSDRCPASWDPTHQRQVASLGPGAFPGILHLTAHHLSPGRLMALHLMTGAGRRLQHLHRQPADQRVSDLLLPAADSRLRHPVAACSVRCLPAMTVGPVTLNRAFLRGRALKGRASMGWASMG